MNGANSAALSSAVPTLLRHHCASLRMTARNLNVQTRKQCFTY
jgi:hypothetical protein